MRVFDPDRLQVPSGHLIHGQLLGGGRAAALDVQRPSKGQAYAALPMGDADLVDRAVEDAHAAWTGSDWARRAPRDDICGRGGRQAVEANLRIKSVLIDFAAQA